MAEIKLTSALIKLYSNQFEIHEVNGKPVPKTSGVWTGTPEEVLAAFTVWIEKYMTLRKRVPLIIEIKEAGQIIMIDSKKKGKPS
ncbi:MAG TPA: hypothetical protein ENI27_10840 [bacterium]|nr:hypothetical protein [bacterium]